MSQRERTRKATSDEIVEIYSLLKQHGKGTEGVYVYESGWSDERVAEQANRGGEERQLPVNAVARIRTKSVDKAGLPVFGNLPMSGKSTGVSALEDRVKAIETALRKIAECVGSKAVRMAIEEALGVDLETEEEEDDSHT